MDELNIMTVNVRSIRAHFEELKLKLNILENRGNTPDIIILTETWIGEDDKNFYCLDNFNSLFSGSLSRRGKGVIMFIRDNLPFSLIDHIEISKCDVVGICVTNNNKPLNVIGVYRNHSSKVEMFINEFETMILKVSKKNKNTVIIGDCNIDLLKDNSMSSKLMDMIEVYGFCQHISSPTRTNKYSSTLIDHLISNVDTNDISWSVDDWSVSDHQIIYTKIKSKCTSFVKSERNEYISLKSYDKEKFKHDVRDCDWTNLCGNNIDEMYKKFCDQFMKIVGDNELIVNGNPRGKKRKDWVTAGIITSIKKKEKLYKKMKKNPTNVSLGEN